MKTPVVLLSIAVCASIAGCAGKDTQDPVFTGSETPPFEYELDERSYHTSWDSSARVGAAVKKPAYRHVLATIDRLDVPPGRLYPQLQRQVPIRGEGGAAALAQGGDKGQAGEVNPMPEGGGAGYHEPSAAILEAMTVCNPSDYDQNGNRIIASARERTDDYIRVRNKLCAGAERLTYEEWEILVNGTPKDLPAYLKYEPTTTAGAE